MQVPVLRTDRLLLRGFEERDLDEYAVMLVDPVVVELLSVIRPANAGSIRMAVALGAVRGETVEFYGASSDLYRYPRPTLAA